METSYISFFLFILSKIIEFLYTILAITIQHLRIFFGNFNLPIRKMAIWFEVLAYKKNTNKQMPCVLYY